MNADQSTAASSSPELEQQSIVKISLRATSMGEIPAHLADLANRPQSLNDVERNLIRHRNYFLFVNRLPPELLVGIFWDYAMSKNSTPEKASWRPLRLVCKHWDNVICGAPLFWRAIDVYSKSSWLALCLRRSVPAPLDITFHSRKFPPQEVAFLYPHAARIRSFTMQHRGDHTWHIAFFPVFVFHMPVLQTFRARMSSKRKFDGSEIYPEFPFSHQNYPCLQSLSLSRMGLPVDVQLLTRLKTLALDTCRTDISTEVFLDVLAASPQLEVLTLNSFLDNLDGSWDMRSTIRRTPITLARLSSLKIEYHSLSVTSVFLSHLRVPATTEVLLRGWIGSEVQKNDIVDPLVKMLPPLAIRNEVLPSLCRSVCVALEVNELDYMLHASDNTLQSEGNIEINVVASGVDDWNDVGLERGMSDLLGIFSTLPLTTICSRGRISHMGVEYWDSLFTSFPTLQTLEMTTSCDSDSRLIPFWTALMAGLDDENSGASMARCPKLVFIIEEYDMRGCHELYSTIVECLRRRAANGFRLETLELSFDTNPDYAAVQDIYIPQIRSLVDRMLSNK
ncbi:hypothetical protein C8Q79DRAFT_177961 [Trametes meyenii]|nr:hypothetical protein C8Q79DRAFT_177961 [Trametes meyenii]